MKICQNVMWKCINEKSAILSIYHNAWNNNENERENENLKK